MKNLAVRAALFLLAASLLAAAPAPPPPGEGWPMLGRSSTRNAVSLEKNAPVHWHAEKKDRKNIQWEADLGSNNCAPPVVAGGLVWVGTNNHRPRDSKMKDDAAVLMCFRAADGKFLWQYVSPRLDDDHQDFPRAGIACTPLVEDDRLYFTTNRAEVVCLLIGPLRRGTGEPRVLWKLDMRKDLGVRPVGPLCPGIGFTCSLGGSYRNRLYVTTGNGVGPDLKTVAAPLAPSLLCLDRDTGKVLWSDRSPGKDALHSQWGSPVVVEARGRVQVIAGQGDGWVRSFDGLTGELLWKFDTNPKAADWKLGGRGTRNHLPATPVFHDGKVYIASGRAQMDGPGEGHLWCIDATRVPKNEAKDLSPAGDNFDPRAAVNKDSGLVWHHGGPVLPAPKKGPVWVFGRTLSSVAIHDGLVIAPEYDGYIHCLDARTGKLCWTHDAEESIIASPLIVDGKVYVPTEGGTVVVLALSREKKRLAANEMPAAAWSAPVFANGVLYLATSGKLYAIRDEAPREEKLEMRQVTVHRVSGDRGKEMAAGVVVVPDAGRGVDMMAAVHVKTLAEAKKGPLASKAGGRCCILAAGPLLDNIWQVQARSLVRRGQELELTIVLADPQKGNRDKTYPLRHLVYLPLELPAGTYKLTTTWRFLESLPEGKPTTAKPLSYSCDFVREK